MEPNTPLKNMIELSENPNTDLLSVLGIQDISVLDIQNIFYKYFPEKNSKDIIEEIRKLMYSLLTKDKTGENQ